MAGPGGKLAGRVSIRVVPDASRFRADLQKVLERVERTVTADLAVTADTRPFRTEVNRLVKDVDGTDVTLVAELDAGTAAARIAAVTRPREVEVNLTLAKTSAARIGAFFASLSGARLAGSFVQRIGTSLLNLDKALPVITAVSLGIAGIGAVALNALGGIGAFVVQLGQLVPIAALLPGLLAGAAAGITVLALAFTSTPAVVKSAASAYKSLQQVVSTNFWDAAAEPIRRFLTDLLPQFRVGFAGLAGSIGGQLAAVADTIRTSLGGDVLATVFRNMSTGVNAATPGLAAFSNAFVTLITFGASYLPRLGAYITDIGTRFDGWLTGVEASGRLGQMIDRAIIVAGQLGDIILNTGSILSGVFGAASKDAIGGLAAGLASVAAIVNSPTFQTALSTIFAGAAQGASGLADALGPIGQMFATLAPTIATILSTSGASLGQFFSQLAAALAGPAFETGLQGFFTGIQQGLAGVGPALPALAAAFASVGQFAGQLAAQLGPVLGATIDTLAPVVTGLLNALQPLIPVLGAALVDALSDPALQTALQQLVTNIADLVTALLPLLPIWVQLAFVLANGLVSAIAALLPNLTQLINQIAGSASLNEAMNTTITAVPIIIGLFTVLGAIVGGLITAVQGIYTTLVGLNSILTGLIAGAVVYIMGIFRSFGALIGDLGTAFGKLFAGDIPGFMAAAQTAASDFFRNMRNAGIGALNAIIIGLNQAIDAINGFYGSIKALTGGAINLKLANIPKIPAAAKGMTVDPTPGGTLVRVAEAGRRESIVDTGGMNRLIARVNSQPTLTSAAGTSIGAVTVVAAPGEDPRITARAWIRELQRS